MKNKGLIIFLIILLAVVAILLTGFMIYLLSGNHHFGNINFGGSSVSSELVFDKTYEEVFDNISINSDAGEIYIKNSNTDEVIVNIYGDTKRLTVKDNKELNITYVAKKCVGFCFNVEKSKIVIYLPKDYDGKISIENRYGNAIIDSFLNADMDIRHNFGDIEIDGLKDGEIVNDCGDIEIGTINKANVHNKFGNIEIKSVLYSLDIEADCGDIDIDKISLEEDSKISNNMGNIDLGKTNDIKIDAHTSLGEIRVKNNNSHADVLLEIDNSCGDITVNN